MDKAQQRESQESEGRFNQRRGFSSGICEKEGYLQYMEKDCVPGQAGRNLYGNEDCCLQGWSYPMRILISSLFSELLGNVFILRHQPLPYFHGYQYFLLAQGSQELNCMLQAHTYWSFTLGASN